MASSAPTPTDSPVLVIRIVILHFKIQTFYIVTTLMNSVVMLKVLQKDAEQEMEMRTEIQNMRLELSTISMMDEFARYARLERKINKMTDKLKTHVKSRAAQQAKIKWIVNIIFYILQAALMVSLIWKYYADPVTVVPSKWISPLERLVAFPSGVAGCTWWAIVLLTHFVNLEYVSS
uniref:Guided entry of tail-anchored proteins factor 1 n=1 Tax=Astyanax mexicanus TaxID=7994 RepID=A0A8B9JUB9_ASTMX